MNRDELYKLEEKFGCEVGAGSGLTPATKSMSAPQMTWTEFVSVLEKMKAKLRKGCRQTIDTSDPEAEEWPINDHACIEVKVGNDWVLLRMPDGAVFFKDFETRDLIFDNLPRTTWLNGTG